MSLLVKHSHAITNSDM